MFLKVITVKLVRDHIPLEQGLRRIYEPASVIAFISQRPYSIRTRIKTPRPTAVNRSRTVRDHIPLEQGLRLLKNIT